MDRNILIDTLNDLIEINNKRISIYNRAIRNIRNATIKNFFSKCSSLSTYFSYQLTCLIMGLGENPQKSGPANLEAAQIAENEPGNVLTKCESEELTVLKIYDRILLETEPSLFPADIWEMICRQRYQIEKSVGALKALLSNPISI